MTDLELTRKYISHANNAKERKIEWTMSFKHFCKLMKQKRCSYTNKLFVEATNHPDMRTIDRICASKPYSDSNTVACINSLNNRKGNLTLEDLNCLIKFLNKTN